MKKYLILICLFPLLGQAETLSESIASLFIKGIEFYSENKTQIDSIYQEIEPIISAPPENRKQLRSIHSALSFPTCEMVHQFAETFKDLLVQAREVM